MGTHDDVIRVFFFGLFQNQWRRRPGQLHGLNRQVGGFDFCGEVFELPGDRFFARGNNLPDVFEHRTIVTGYNGRLRYAHNHDPPAAGSSKDAGGIDDGVAYAGKINRGKDGFHGSSISQRLKVRCAEIVRRAALVGGSGLRCGFLETKDQAAAFKPAINCIKDASLKAARETSPAIWPARSTIIRRQIPMSSGNSEDTTSIALPSQASSSSSW